MDSILPGGIAVSIPRLYGDYGSVREVTVRLFKDTDICYYLLTGDRREPPCRKVYSLLCTKIVNGILTESEYVYDLAPSYDEALRIYTLLYRNTVTPCCMLEVLEEILG